MPPGEGSGVDQGQPRAGGGGWGEDPTNQIRRRKWMDAIIRQEAGYTLKGCQSISGLTQRHIRSGKFEPETFLLWGCSAKLVSYINISLTGALILYLKFQRKIQRYISFCIICFYTPGFGLSFSVCNFNSNWNSCLPSGLCVTLRCSQRELLSSFSIYCQT